jgi:hypothetical protein
MGHADIDTTMRYLHHRPRADEARLLEEAFKVDEPASGLQANGLQTAANGFHTPTADEVEGPAQPAFSRQEAESPGSP